LRGEGAWEPFGADSSTEQDSSSAAVDNGTGAYGLAGDKGDRIGRTAVQQQPAPGGRWGWWGARRAGHADSGQQEQTHSTGQLRSKL
jgi:hypothetical protein